MHAPGCSLASGSKFNWLLVWSGRVPGTGAQQGRLTRAHDGRSALSHHLDDVTRLHHAPPPGSYAAVPESYPILQIQSVVRDVEATLQARSEEQSARQARSGGPYAALRGQKPGAVAHQARTSEAQEKQARNAEVTAQHAEVVVLGDLNGIHLRYKLPCQCREKLLGRIAHSKSVKREAQLAECRPATITTRLSETRVPQIDLSPQQERLMKIKLAKTGSFRDLIMNNAGTDSKLRWKLARWGRTRTHEFKQPAKLPPLRRTLNAEEVQTELVSNFHDKAKLLRERFFPEPLPADTSDMHTSAMTELTRACWQWEHYPQVFKTARTVVLKKPGKKDYCEAGAWRPIALLDTVGKIIETATAREMKQLAEVHGMLPAQQMGARRGRSRNSACELPWRALSVLISMGIGSTKPRNLA
ncbi:hypothetical protein ACJ73_05736 [Blastomyces percursus]|uniref:Reverse transcriptase domain-containing protein n=1 Tax=Blastomyces percursus TaxID=1658174 RepID=A0A1J9Q2S0_9EURO|nr:hypothetical protein ACJ73_05736 [Blastomyces percursus]